MRALCICSLVFVSLGALAQTTGSASPPSAAEEVPVEVPVEVRYEKRTIIDISEATIEGVVVGPSTTAVRTGKRPTFKHLIRLRPDFRKELSATTASLSTGPASR